MADEERRSPVYKLLGVAFAALVVVAAAAGFVALAPSLHRQLPTEKLTAALEAAFPGTQPQVGAPAGTGTLQVELTVRFDPTVQAEKAYEAFERVSRIAEAQQLKGITALATTLNGQTLEGSPASASRTVAYEPSRG
jgi:hypothetical protein